MAIIVYCKACGKKNRAPDAAVGKQGKCACGASMIIPSQSEPERKEEPVALEPVERPPSTAPANIKQTLNAPVDLKASLKKLSAGQGCMGGCLIIVILLIIGWTYIFFTTKDSSSMGPDKKSAWVMSQLFVEKSLKAPASASYPIYNESFVTDLGVGDCGSRIVMNYCANDKQTCESLGYERRKYCEKCGFQFPQDATEAERSDRCRRCNEPPLI